MNKPDAVKAYFHAKEFVIDRGFAQEISWQASLDLENVTESAFLHEAAWVVLSAGMREAVVRKLFPDILSAFLGLHDAKEIASNRSMCVSSARKTFNHKGKIEAIADIASLVHREGMETIIQSIREDGIEFLRMLPFIGPITAFHLAKNLGLDVVKPDRHLVRIADASGYESPGKLCQEISGWSGDKVAVVDIVLWRFATLEPDYLSVFENRVRS